VFIIAKVDRARMISQTTSKCFFNTKLLKILDNKALPDSLDFWDGSLKKLLVILPVLTASP